jgi:ABC-2 type transport system permease protein
MDLIAHLKSSVPVNLHYIIKDMMETITFYDNKIIDINELPNNQLEIKFYMRKMDNTLSNELEAVNVLLAIGQYDSDGNLLQIEEVKASSGENKITFYKKPGTTNILLDPFMHFIELNVENNRKNIMKKE